MNKFIPKIPKRKTFPKYFIWEKYRIFIPDPGTRIKLFGPASFHCNLFIQLKKRGREKISAIGIIIKVKVKLIVDEIFPEESFS